MRSVLGCQFNFEDSDAEAGDYARAFNAQLWSLRKLHGYKIRDVLALDRVYAWAGHVARFAKWLPERY
eukprot:4408153-Lingulodinium_polyedra.AAC.1